MWTANFLFFQRTNLLMRCQSVRVVPRGGVDVSEAGEGGGGGQRILALHGEDELVAVRGQGLLVVALAEVGRPEVAVSAALPGQVRELLGHHEVLFERVGVSVLT